MGDAGPYCPPWPNDAGPNRCRQVFPALEVSCPTKISESTVKKIAPRLAAVLAALSALAMSAGAGRTHW